jgi:template-activating factor I
MSKKAKTDPTELDPKVEAAVDELKKMQDKIEKVEEQFDQKVLELQAEFDKKKRPIFVERNTVIAKIPNFWYTAIVHHKAIEPLLLLEDEDIFAYCTSVFVDEKENVKKGFKIKMTFSSNAFFDDTELWKDVEYGEDGEAKLTHSGVTWKPGKNPGAAETTAEGKKRDRVEPSFLRFFEEESPDDLELAELIKEDLWSNPLQYYTGEAGDEFDDMEEFEEIDVDEEEEDLEDDEEEEEAEGGEKPK